MCIFFFFSLPHILYCIFRSHCLSWLPQLLNYAHGAVKSRMLSTSPPIARQNSPQPVLNAVYACIIQDPGVFWLHWIQRSSNGVNHHLLHNLLDDEVVLETLKELSLHLYHQQLPHPLCGIVCEREKGDMRRPLLYMKIAIYRALMKIVLRRKVKQNLSQYVDDEVVLPMLDINGVAALEILLLPPSPLLISAICISLPNTNSDQ